MRKFRALFISAIMAVVVVQANTQKSEKEFSVYWCITHDFPEAEGQPVNSPLWRKGIFCHETAKNIVKLYMVDHPNFLELAREEDTQ